MKKIQYFGWLIPVLALLILTTGMASVAAQEQGKSEPMPPAKLTTDSNKAALRYDAGATDKTTGTTIQLTEQDFISLLNDVEYLRAEIQRLRGFIETGKGQIASIDEDVLIVSTDLSDASILEGKLADMDQRLETLLKRENSQHNNSMGIGHGEIVFGGLLQQHYYKRTGNNDESSFNLKTSRLSLKGNINRFVKMRFQAEFAGSPKLIDGYLTLSPFCQWLFRIGQFKRPFGTEYLKSTSSLPFVKRARLSSLETARDIGFDVSYAARLTEGTHLRLIGGLFNGSGINTSDVNSDKNVVGRMQLELLDIIEISPNFTVGKSNDTGILKQDLSAYGGSVTLHYGSRIVQGELIRSEIGDDKRLGWAIWGGQMISTHMAFVPEVQILARYEIYDVDTDVDDDRVSAITLGTTLFVDRKYAKVQINYLINGEEGNSIDNNELLLNFQVAF
ncbi:MAG: hypothetical protein KAU36_09780 [candidate division Zixibacteria bacterium]|nr:hypothetical protein [candidate division Zixibacteria bacterium]